MCDYRNEPDTSADLHKVTVKYATFNRADPETWFVQIKVQFIQTNVWPKVNEPQPSPLRNVTESTPITVTSGDATTIWHLIAKAFASKTTAAHVRNTFLHVYEVLNPYSIDGVKFSHRHPVQQTEKVTSLEAMIETVTT